MIIKLPKNKKKKSKKKPKKYTYWRNKLDKAIGTLVREKGYCEWCKSGTNQLQDAHVIGRANKTLRWDIMNHLCLCSYCHRFKWHENPLIAQEWFKNTYPERYQYLMRAKNIIADRTEEDYKILLEAIKNKDFNKLIVPQEILDEIDKTT